MNCEGETPEEGGGKEVERKGPSPGAKIPSLVLKAPSEDIGKSPCASAGPRAHREDDTCCYNAMIRLWVQALE